MHHESMWGLIGMQGELQCALKGSNNIIECIICLLYSISKAFTVCAPVLPDVTATL